MHQFNYVEIVLSIVLYGSETTVQFNQEEYIVYESNGTVQLDAYRSFPSGNASCTCVGKDLHYHLSVCLSEVEEKPLLIGENEVSR